MFGRLLPALIVLGIGFALGILWNAGTLLPWASAQGTGQAPVAGAAAVAPVVACTPYLSVTEYEEDPFNPDRVRRTRTTVSSIVIVRADGSTETKRVGN